MRRFIEWLRMEENFWPILGLIGIVWMLMGVVYAPQPGTDVKRSAAAKASRASQEKAARVDVDAKRPIKLCRAKK